MSVEYYRNLLRSVFEGKKCILCTGPLAGQGKHIKTLRELGATSFLILADGEGTGEIPTGEDVFWEIVVEGQVADMMTGLRRYDEALRNPSEEVRAAVDKFDPDCEAIVLAAHISDVQHILGRVRLGAREPSWAALEDKVIIDEFWDQVGILRAPAAILESKDLDACLQAAQELDEGAGTIWAGDAREGYNGGASYLRYIRPGDDTKEAHSFFREHCDRLRIMPFLRGIPCSIHGVVLPDDVLAFRPVEMVVLQRANSQKLLYAGFSTFWDPPEEDREQMREIARRVGLALRESVGYRGAFTVDGILTAGLLAHGTKSSERRCFWVAHKSRGRAAPYAA